MNSSRTLFWAVAVGLAFPLSGRAQNLAGDEALSKVLMEGEDWQLVSEGFGFTDAACADERGNFYFFDLGKGTGIRRIGADGKVSTFIDHAPRCSGLKFGPDGRFYACTQGPKKQVVALEVPSGKITVLADDAQPNDLVVSHKGFVYFTETGKGRVRIVDGQGNARVGPPASTSQTASRSRRTRAHWRSRNTAAQMFGFTASNATAV